MQRSEQDSVLQIPENRFKLKLIQSSVFRINIIFSINRSFHFRSSNSNSKSIREDAEEAFYTSLIAFSQASLPIVLGWEEIRNCQLMSSLFR